jgi:hypothetical protein
MKIYVLGSNRFVKEMVAHAQKLRDLGLDGWIHPDYEAFVKGEKMDIWTRAHAGEHVQVKIENNYMKEHYHNIISSDAVLIINNEKDGKKNYIGPNVLMEMGQAYVNNKKIFLLNEVPFEVPHADEILTCEPICLHSDLSNIKKYL